MILIVCNAVWPRLHVGRVAGFRSIRQNLSAWIEVQPTPSKLITIRRSGSIASLHSSECSSLIQHIWIQLPILPWDSLDIQVAWSSSMCPNRFVSRCVWTHRFLPVALYFRLLLAFYRLWWSVIWAWNDDFSCGFASVLPPEPKAETRRRPIPSEEVQMPPPLVRPAAISKHVASTIEEPSRLG